MSDPDWEHRDVLTIIGWSPVKWRCKHCHGSARDKTRVHHRDDCAAHAKDGR